MAGAVETTPEHDEADMTGGSPRSRPPVEIGLLASGVEGDEARAAVRRLPERLKTALAGWFPQFDWQISLGWREDVVPAPTVEPVDLLERGRDERDARRWDFVIVIAGCDFVAHDKPFAMAAVSRAFDAAVVSTKQLGRQTTAEGAGEPVEETVLRRLQALLLHTFGHLNGLEHAESPDDVMYEVESADDLDGMHALGEEAREEMRENLWLVADPRLEEREDAKRANRPWFYVRGGWMNLHEIRDAVLRTRPWEFPVRLSRLTAAAVSSAVVLMITAEVWEVAATFRTWALVLLSVVSLAVTTAYVAVRQRLLVGRHYRRISEQKVVTNLTAVSVVFCGLFSTFALLFVLGLFSMWFIFGSRVVANWTGAAASETGTVYVAMSVFCAALGIIVGALGASFEEQHHFRHVIFVDEET